MKCRAKEIFRLIEVGYLVGSEHWCRNIPGPKCGTTGETAIFDWFTKKFSGICEVILRQRLHKARQRSGVKMLGFSDMDTGLRFFIQNVYLILKIFNEST